MARPTPDHFALVGTLFEQKFRIDDVVAEGGFGVVYRAVQAHLERTVALKVLKLPPELDEVSRARVFEGFQREARAILKVNHPNIVQVLDFGISVMPDGRRAPWMALEWLDGVTLRKDLHKRRHAGGRTPSQVLALLRPVLEALAYTHDAGIAHRDLKPANLMLVQTRRGVELKLLDFGIAKLMENDEEAGTGDTATSAQYTAFSLNYAAPEQISGTRTGPWTDVHAMGLILTEMLVDESPYGVNDRAELFARIMAEKRPTPAKFEVDVGAWEPVLAKAVALRPVERHKNAAELLEALWQNLAGAVASANRANAAASALTSTPPDSSSQPSADPVAFRVATPATSNAMPPANDPIWSPKTLPAGSGGATDGVVSLTAAASPHGMTRPAALDAVEPEEPGVTTLRGATTTGRGASRGAGVRWAAALAVAAVVVSVGVYLSVRGGGDTAASGGNDSASRGAQRSERTSTDSAFSATPTAPRPGDPTQGTAHDADAAGPRAALPADTVWEPAPSTSPSATGIVNPWTAATNAGAAPTVAPTTRPPTAHVTTTTAPAHGTRTTRGGTRGRGPTGNEALPVD